MPQRYSKAGHHPDYFLFTIVIILTIAGLLILTSASSDLGKTRFNDSYYYIKHQLLYGLSFGIIGFIIGFFIYYRHYRKAAFFFLLSNIILLALVFTALGSKTGGASRWLSLGPIIFQPAELLKLSFVVYVAAWLSNPKANRTEDIRSGLIPFFIVCAIIAGMLIIQPATSTVVILLSAAGIMYFVSGARILHIAIVGLIGLLALAAVIYATPYRWERIKSFLNPERDTQGSSYQINQSLIAIGSGGLWGVGYGQSKIKLNTLPAPLDDSIFAIAAQELGFVGSGSLVVLFGALIFRLLYIARMLRDKFGQLILIGFAVIIGLQSLINMGAISGLLPLTGIPLPLISYGGTALATFLTMIGISLNVSKYT